MSLDSQIANRRIKRIGPLSKIFGLMTACLVSIIGMSTGLAPEIILWRAFVSACLSGAIVAFGISVIQVANDKRL
jgi:hypothetical protein